MRGHPELLHRGAAAGQGDAAPFLDMSACSIPRYPAVYEVGTRHDDPARVHPPLQKEVAPHAERGRRRGSPGPEGERGTCCRRAPLGGRRLDVTSVNRSGRRSACRWCSIWLAARSRICDLTYEDALRPMRHRQAASRTVLDDHHGLDLRLGPRCLYGTPAKTSP